jgi:hypothetical protein
MTNLIKGFSGKKLDGTNEKSKASFRLISEEEFEDFRKEFKTVLFQN